MTIIRGISLATWCLLMQATAVHAQNPSGIDEEKFGVIVMAHGGPQAWNEGVTDMLRPLSRQYDMEIAFGMADAYSLQEAVSKLESRGVTDIGVVRLFISGESWLARTGQILGLQQGAPERPEPEMHGEHGGHVQHSGYRMEFWQVDSDARFRLSQEGLSQAPEMDAVLLERVLALSTYPENEDVLVLAHGPGDDAENERWLQSINERMTALRGGHNFNNIKVATLREDWPEKRQAAQTIVRDYVRAANDAGRAALIVPYRVHGFGPYAEVLEGLDYVADETGLVPHPAVAHWIARQIQTLQ
jgi:sirohydrochlorin ferrochelatase